MWTSGFLVIFSFSLNFSRGTQIGRNCKETVTCGVGAFCTGSGVCYCLSTYTVINGYCWIKINPGQSGCVHTKQCEATWPFSYCSNGVCKCNNNRPPFITKDGPICLDYGQCPTNGDASKYKFSGTIIPCYNGADELCPSETFDCICSEETCMREGFCCPTRAFACIQPKDEGKFITGSAIYSARYYFDSITFLCKSFKYRGKGGNANNFRSLDQCISYCQTGCFRGNPQYSDTVKTTDNKILKVSVLGCPIDSCGSSYGCTSATLQNKCCPHTNYICSKSGGLQYKGITPLPPTAYDSGDKISEWSPTLTRFYFDETKKQCSSFNYNGQAGNFNNFLTELDCNIVCSSVVCPRGIPLQDAKGVANVKCGDSDQNCPTSHYCLKGACCPTNEFICKLPKQLGSCSERSVSWWYNATSGNCQKFTWTGCNGNYNNFPSYYSCHIYCQDVRKEPQCIQGEAAKDTNGNYIKCAGLGITSKCPANYFCYYHSNMYGCCPTQSMTCSLKANGGRQCGPSVLRWFFDSRRQSCETFLYKGCDGNSNNFVTEQDCLDYCDTASSCPDGGEILKDSTTGEVRTCFKTNPCPNSHKCTEISVITNYGYRKYHFCCPTKNFICSLEKKAGIECFSSNVNRYWFNKDTRTCEKFSFRGCQGNRNNFATEKACQNYCLSSACPSGTVVAQTSHKVHQCDTPGLTGQASKCPIGYLCRSSTLLRMNVCCGASQATTMRLSVCPSQSVPYISSLTSQPLQCQPNVIGSCPGEYFCWFATDSSTRSYYCCRNLGNDTSKELCPPELTPISDMSSSSSYKECSPSADNDQNTSNCGPHSLCQYTAKLVKYICCGKVPEKPNICPPKPVGLKPVLLNDDYRKCIPTAKNGTINKCPHGSVCLWISKSKQFICCGKQANSTTTTTISTTTTTTMTALFDSGSADCSGQIGFKPVTPFPSTCSPFLTSSCDQFQNQGSMVRCLWSWTLTKFVCCHSLFNIRTYTLQRYKLLH